MPVAPSFRLDDAGYFCRGAHRIFPVGVNYWPASSGLRMWSQWNPIEIATDFALVAGLGLNTVRVFLRWEDFAPTTDAFDEQQFERLDWLLAEAEAAGLWVDVSLFVGWMSGGLFWPPWKGDRNLFADVALRERAAAFAGKAAAVLARFPDTVLAVDLGNELGCVPDSATASRQHVAEWCSCIVAAVRAEFPGVLLAAGCDHGQVVNDTPWTFDNQPGTDFLTIHAYPVPNWNPVPLGGLGDPLTQRLFGFYCAYARGHGPVLLQEFASIHTQGPHARAFLAAAIPAAIAAGANGLLWWTLHDIVSNEPPYGFQGFERTLGLVDREGLPKPAFAEFTRQLAAWARDPETLPSPASPNFFLYLPAQRDGISPADFHRPNPPRETGRRLLCAWHLAHEAGLVPGFARVAHLPPPEAGPLLLTGVNVLPSELSTLAAWVEAGGTLVWHGVSRLGWDHDWADFLGARPVDYALPQGCRCEWHDTEWHFPYSPSQVRLVVEPTTARVMLRDSDGHPLLLQRTAGRGRVVYSLPFLEDAALAERAQTLTGGDRWSRWFAPLARTHVSTPPQLEPSPAPKATPFARIPHA
jgi:hypothetical protein